ncbi:cytochrome c and c1 heme-lyase [Biscogniauxia sp. FL1348]|nr:cytochrome c and c1 heme-lyase [Biscogniauxia sp. FL1348]
MSDSKHEGQTACPVDHKSREIWLSQARAANDGGGESASLPPSHPPVTTTTATASCPVDHKARDVWIQQARAAAAPPPPAGAQPPHSSSSSSSSSWTSYLPRIPFFSRPPAQQQPLSSSNNGTPILGTEREVSTIPRTPVAVPSTPSPSETVVSSPTALANHEQETGVDEASGNWIYPSEKMFFDAMRRKGHDPRTTDMRTVVPIHNAVNERAWAEIKAWEEPWVKGTSCDGPRLHSFSGLSTQLSPRARFNALLGYQAPFDRHDWVVDRCGKEIEYVIDFYAGRGAGSASGGKPLSFYLDVRPKLNTWEGVKMRAMRATGLT